MLNLTLVGNLGADATVGVTRKGTPIATLSVAVNQVRTDTTTGERSETAEWFRVRAVSRLVDLAQRLTKGTRVLVIGRLDIGHYQSREGEARVSYDVWVDELIPFNPRSDSAGSAGERRGNDASQPAQPPTPTAAGTRVQRADPSQLTTTSRTPRNEDDEDLPW